MKRSHEKGEATTPRRLQMYYEEGKNIAQLLREEQNVGQNTSDIIEIAYELQTGSYIDAMEDADMLQHKEDYTSEIVRVIRSLCNPSSVMEAGVGEATTLSGVLEKLGEGVASYGFDLSWSRVAYGRSWLERRGFLSTTLCTGNLFDIPFADSSIDVVYTSHSIEPNRGGERQILQELHRVARRFVVLLEPGYELASEEARKRMDSHGYCKGLRETAEALGYRVLKNEMFPFAANPLNPTALTVLQKEQQELISGRILACPRFKTPLERIGDMFFSPEALLVYPIVGGIPCLRVENGILASKYKDVMQERSHK